MVVPAGFTTGFPARVVLGLQRLAKPPARGLSDEGHRHRQGPVLSRLSQAARSRETESQALVVLRLMTFQLGADPGIFLDLSVQLAFDISNKHFIH